MAVYRTVTANATLSDNTVQAEGTVSDEIARVTAVSQSVQPIVSSDYADLTNKPKINSHTLEGNQSSADLGLASAEHIHTGTFAIPRLAVKVARTIIIQNTPQTIYFDYTPTGTVTVSPYTPEGTVSAPAITVTPTTDTVNSITDVGTLPEWNATVTGEVLSFAFNSGTLPTKGADKTVMTGVSATAEAPTFTGTDKAPTASFSGVATPELTTLSKTVSFPVS